MTVATAVSYITAIGTAVPGYRFAQMQIAGFMAQTAGLIPEKEKQLRSLYRHTAIRTRHSVLPDFDSTANGGQYRLFNPAMAPPTTAQRMAIYREECVPLAARAADACFAERELTNPGFDRRSVTHLVYVSCTGLFAPGPDVDLVDVLGLNRSVQRIGINFMGCHGAFNGLKVADAIARSSPDAVILVVCLELCTLHFSQRQDTDSLLANALFADGAAAVLVEAGTSGLALTHFYSEIIPDSKTEMSWTIGDAGFDMILATTVPQQIRAAIKEVLYNLLRQANLRLTDLGGLAIHPGGKRILDLIEKELDTTAAVHTHARAVLQEYGNMSSATIVFVIERFRQELSLMPEPAKPVVACAFGPGLTIEAMVLTPAGKTQ